MEPQIAEDSSSLSAGLVTAKHVLHFCNAAAAAGECTPPARPKHGSA